MFNRDQVKNLYLDAQNYCEVCRRLVEKHGILFQSDLESALRWVAEATRDYIDIFGVKPPPVIHTGEHTIHTDFAKMPDVH